MLTPTFHFKILNDFLGVFNDQIDVMMNKLEGKCQKGPFNIFNDITLCALDIICGRWFKLLNISEGTSRYDTRTDFSA